MTRATAADAAKRIDDLLVKLAEHLLRIEMADDDPRVAQLAGAVDVVLDLRRAWLEHLKRNAP